MNIEHWTMKTWEDSIIAKVMFLLSSLSLRKNPLIGSRGFGQGPFYRKTCVEHLPFSFESIPRLRVETMVWIVINSHFKKNQSIFYYQHEFTNNQSQIALDSLIPYKDHVYRSDAWVHLINWNAVKEFGRAGCYGFGLEFWSY